MKFLVLVIFFQSIAMLSHGKSAINIKEIQVRCQKPKDNEPTIYNSDFHWFYTWEQMSDRFLNIYQSGKRLSQRAYYNEELQSLVLPWVYKDEVQFIKITPHLIQAIQHHIEESLKNKYADFIFFPDMGHSHLYFKEDHWQETYNNIPSAEGVYKHYEKMLNDPEMYMLYHTAEQLQEKDSDTQQFLSPELEYRYWNRNPVGKNNDVDPLVIYKDPTQSANSVSSLPGYHSWSAGYNLSASQNGCFEFQHGGQIYYFDISLYDLPSDPNAPIDYN